MGEACFFFHKAAFLRQWPCDRDLTRCGGVGRRLCERGLGRVGMGAMGGTGTGPVCRALMFGNGRVSWQDWQF
jgi:hypothetical protein